MSDSHWAEIKKILDEVESIPETAREAWLREVCGKNQTLFNQVHTLLKDPEQLTGELGNPFWQDVPSLELKPGQQLGAWRLLRILGSGGMGDVWLAERADDSFEMLAAIKLIKGAFVSKDAVSRFKRERQLLADLKHPNIAILHDGGTLEGQIPYLVMEYVEGETINTWCSANKPDQQQILNLFRQLCLAVAHAHSKGVLHRDIKPGNVMVDVEGHVKLMDFGIARSDKNEDLTSIFVPMTPAYASPERLKGAPATEKADIYALGLVLLNMVADLAPADFQGAPLETFQEWLGTQDENYDGIAALLSQMLAVELENRIASVAKIIAIVDQLLSNRDLGDEVDYETLIWHHPNLQEQAEQLVNRLKDEHQLLSIQLSADSMGDMPTGSHLLDRCGAMLVMVDGEGPFPWEDRLQRQELVSAQSRLKRRVVPVIIGPGNRPERESDLPGFLRKLTWFELNDANQSPLDQLARTLRGLKHESTEVSQSDVCPFRGLEAFREQDAPFFFGQETAIQRLEHRLQKHRFLVVSGASGSGKSSLVQAGLIPILRKQKAGVFLMTPTANPLKELVFVLLNHLPTATPEELFTRLKRQPECLYFLLSEIMQSYTYQWCCLIVDQLEELFTLVKDKELVEAFLENLFYAFEQDDASLSVVMTLRSDFIGQCALWPQLSEYCGDNLILLEPLTQDQLQAAMTEPARLAGLTWEKGLPERILDDISGGDADLPLMEHALLELYERRRGRKLTAAAYTEIGGIEGALAQRAEALYSSLSSAGREAVRKMFTLCLIHPGEGTEDTRRRSSWEELQAVSPDKSLTEDVINRFVDARLLTSKMNEGKDEVQIDVSHEALIRRWDRIRSWMDEDRELARQLDILRDRAQSWDEGERQEAFLLRGAQLLQMKELSQHDGLHLGELARAFLTASTALEERVAASKRLVRNVLVALTGSAILMAAVSFWMFFRANKATVESKKAEEIALSEQKRAEYQTLEANYNLSIAFEDKIEKYLWTDQADQGWLGSLAALSVEIPFQKDLPQHRGRVFDFRMDYLERVLWVSPVAHPTQMVRSSASGRYLALVGLDQNIRIFDKDYGIQLKTFSGQAGDVSDLAFSHDEQYLAVAFNQGSSGLWRLEDGRLEFFEQHHPTEISSIAFDPLGRFVATTDRDGLLHLVQMDGSIAYTRERTGTPINDIIFEPSGKTIFIACDNGILRTNLDEMKWHKIETADGLPTALGWFNGLVSGWKDGSVRFHLPQGTLKRKEHGSAVVDLTGDGKGEHLVSLAEGEVKHWSMENDLQVTDLVTLKGAVSLSLDPALILNLCHSNGRFVRYDLLKGKTIGDLAGHSDRILDVSYSPNGRLFASASRDKTVILWDSEGLEPPRRLNVHEKEVSALSFSPDGRILATGSQDLTLRLWALPEKPLSDQNPMNSYVLIREAGVINAVDFSPDGSHFVASTGNEIHVWKRNENKFILIAVLEGHTEEINALDISPDGLLLASGSMDRTIRIWQLGDLQDANESGPIQDSLEVDVLYGHKGAVTCLDFSSDGQMMVSGGNDRSLRIWDVRSGENTATYFQAGVNHDLEVSQDNRTILSVSDDSFVRLWHLDEMRKVTHISGFVGHSDTPYSATFSPDGTQFLSGGADCNVRIWKYQSGASNLETLELDRNASYEFTDPLSVQAHTAQGMEITFSPDGNFLASSSIDRSLMLLRNAAQHPHHPKWQLKINEAHDDVITGIDFSPDQRWLASAGGDQIVRIWKLPNQEAFLSGFKGEVNRESMTYLDLAGHPGRVTDVAFSPQGNLLAGASTEEIFLWRLPFYGAEFDSAALQTAKVLGGHQGTVVCLEFSPDGSILASSSLDKTVRLWSLKDDPAIEPNARTLSGHSSSVYGLDFSPDGKMLASASFDYTVRIWNVEDATLVKVLRGHRHSVFSANFSPDGKWLASSSGEEGIFIWRVADGRLMAKLGRLEMLGWFIDYAPSGKVIAASDVVGSVKLYPVDMDKMPPPNVDERQWYGELLNRSLYFFAFRQEGFNFIPEPHMRFYDPTRPEKPHPYHRLDRPRPRGIPVFDWLTQDMAP